MFISYVLDTCTKEIKGWKEYSLRGAGFKYSFDDLRK